MILRINIKPEDVLRISDSQILVKVHHYTAFAEGANLMAFDGDTLEEYEEAFQHSRKGDKLARKFKRGKTLFVGTNGGLSLE